MPFDTQIEILKRALHNTGRDIFTCFIFSLIAAGLMFYLLAAVKAMTGAPVEILLKIGIIASLAIGVLSPFVLLPKFRKKIRN